MIYITVAENASSVEITIVDDEQLPTIAVAPVNDIVFEGESVQFRVTSSLLDAVSVNYFLVDSLGLSEGYQVVNITNGEAIVEVATETIPGVQADATSSITLIDGIGYNLTPPIANNSASVIVTDHEEIRISLSAPEFVFEPAESDVIRFIVSLSRAPETELSIQLSIRFNLPSLERPETEEITFQPGETTQFYDFPIEHYQQFQEPYTIVATLVEGEGYAPVTQQSVATVTVLDSSTPEVSIAAELRLV